MTSPSLKRSSRFLSRPLQAASLAAACVCFSLAAAALPACAQQTAAVAVQQQSLPADSLPQAHEVLNARDALERVLIGEFALQQNDPMRAYKEFMRAAQKSRQAGIAERAFEAAEMAQDEEAVNAAPESASLLLLSQGYPEKAETMSKELVDRIESKDLKVYAEFVSFADTVSQPQTLTLERVVVVDSTFVQGMPAMKLLTINGSYVLPEKQEQTILAVAKVAGMDKAVYGLKDTPFHSLLYRYDDNILVATSALSHFADARFVPQEAWKSVWEGILSKVKGKPVEFHSWLNYVKPMFGRDDVLSKESRRQSVEKGIQWFYNGHFLVDNSWKKDWVDKSNASDTAVSLVTPLPSNVMDGDGSLGVIQGHCSYIYWDGSQQYTYWMRNDVQGESSMAFALAGKLLNKEDYYKVASHLVEHSLGEYRDGPRSDPKSPSYGLLGWALTHKGHYYQDDNARSILGMLAAVSLTGQS